MTGLLKTILFLLVLYYAWKLMFRLMFPVVLKKATEKAQRSMNERMQQAFEQQQNQNSNQFEGDITIKRGAEKAPSVAKNDGEYVDYVEVKDK
jgi:hypothetical protein